MSSPAAPTPADRPGGDPLRDTSPRFADVGGGMTLCYETFGDATDPTVLLIMGLGGQMIEWHRDLCLELVSQGFHVVRFDNRDAGLSTHIDQPVDVLNVLQAAGTDDQPSVPYLLADMARDAIGLLDHLGIRQAHAVGISLGGMIAQQMAIDHPDRVATLVSVMSRTGDTDTGLPTPAAMTALLQPPPATREEAIERGLSNARTWGSDGVDEDEIRDVQSAKWDRHRDPYGPARQLGAILTSGDRTGPLSELQVPTLAIHGTKDQLIQPDGGERLAAVVPDAKLLLIEGMGHDLARWTWPQLVNAITAHAAEHPPVS